MIATQTMLVFSAPRSTTDIYPTRYAAFDDPGTLYEFKPIDGMLRHCRADSRPMDAKDFMVGNGVGELAVYYDPERQVYAEVFGMGIKGFKVDCVLRHVGKTRVYQTYQGALNLALRFIETGSHGVVPARRG